MKDPKNIVILILALALIGVGAWAYLGNQVDEEKVCEQYVQSKVTPLQEQYESTVQECEQILLQLQEFPGCAEALSGQP